MTQEEIIEMAKRARLHRNQHNLASNPVQYRFSYDGTEEALIAFTKLVAAAEREACAKICDSFQERDVGMQPAECAGAIRRGQA